MAHYDRGIEETLRAVRPFSIAPAIFIHYINPIKSLRSLR